MRQFISADEFHTATRQFVGLPISRVWRGAGTAVFFELGDLLSEETKRKNAPLRLTQRGQATINLEIGWRVERSRSILIGSSSSDRKIHNALKKIQGLKIAEISVQGRLPEIVVELTGNLWLHSLTTWEGQPEWTLFFNNKTQWLMTRNGRLCLTTQEK